MNYYKIRDYQPQSMVMGQNFGDDVCLSPGTGSKKKKNGISDPRFKRVITTESGAQENFNAEKIVANLTRAALEERITNEGTSLTDKVISYLKAPNETPLFSVQSVKKFQNLERGEEGYEEDEEHATAKIQNPTEIVTRDVGFEPGVKCLQDKEESIARSREASFVKIQNFENLDDSRKNNKSNSNLKKSASDCTMHTKVDENQEEEVRIAKPYPSASRLNKVHNWMNDCKLPAEKRRSVITVIGQTQNKPFSKILNEINQRRKLAKELDKHALCKAIMESAENQTDVKNLIAQVDFVLPDGKIIYSTEKILLRRDNSKYQREKDIGADDFGQKTIISGITDASDKLRKRCEMIPERDSSISQVGKRSKSKRSGRRLGAGVKENAHVKDKMKFYFARISSVLFWPSLVLLCLIMLACAFYSKTNCPYPYLLSDFLKPKNRAWYKKILL